MIRRLAQLLAGLLALGWAVCVYELQRRDLMPGKPTMWLLSDLQAILFLAAVALLVGALALALA